MVALPRGVTSNLRHRKQGAGVLRMMLSAVALSAACFGVAGAQLVAQGQSPDVRQPVLQAPSVISQFPTAEAASDMTVIARGSGGALTIGAVDAYIEALEFCLAEIGQPARFDDTARAQILRQFSHNFAALPADMQHGLADARATWDGYREAWPALDPAVKREFAFDVLSLAYGESAAAQALGLGGAASPGGGGQASGGFDQPYAGSDCWASAGCTDYDPSTGSYTYENYD